MWSIGITPGWMVNACHDLGKNAGTSTLSQRHLLQTTRVGSKSTMIYQPIMSRVLTVVRMTLEVTARERKEEGKRRTAFLCLND
ncbi:hypothetical protein KCU83_g517, partial [Aureobasidium melanogenum]